MHHPEGRSRYPSEHERLPDELDCNAQGLVETLSVRQIIPASRGIAVAPGRWRCYRVMEISTKSHGSFPIAYGRAQRDRNDAPFENHR